jgi:hypothetical protein
MAPYYQTFSPTSGQAPSSSSNSSPASANLPSPSTSALDNSVDATNPNTSAGPFNYTPISPVQTASPQYEFDYNPHASSLNHSNSQSWGGSNEDHRGLDMYSRGPSELYSTYGYTSPIDAQYSGYETSDQTMPGLSGTPPSSSFNVSTLPFRGLDYIRNYNPGGYLNSEQDSLWQTYDPGAFGYDPDLPFSLGDTSLDIRDVTNQS